VLDRESARLVAAAGGDPEGEGSGDNNDGQNQGTNTGDNGGGDDHSLGD